MAMPSAGPPSEQALIGSTGAGDRKHAPTSVPPEQLITGTREPPTVSNSQRYGSGFHGSPVVTKVRSDARSLVGLPCGISARTSVGDRPSDVTRSCSTVSHSRNGVGQSGAPSRKTTVPPSAPTPTTVHGPMIQPMSVAKSIASPSCTSAWYAASRAIETRKPPCTCTTPFGLPVVPEVYVNRYGVSASTCSAGSSPGYASSSNGASTTCTSTPVSRTTSSIGICLPRRDELCCVITTFASLASSRCLTAGAATPENPGTWNAPRCAIACEATATSVLIGR